MTAPATIDVPNISHGSIPNGNDLQFNSPVDVADNFLAVVVAVDKDTVTSVTAVRGVQNLSLHGSPVLDGLGMQLYVLTLDNPAPGTVVLDITAVGAASVTSMSAASIPCADVDLALGLGAIVPYFDASFTSSDITAADSGATAQDFYLGFCLIRAHAPLLAGGGQTQLAAESNVNGADCFSTDTVVGGGAAAFAWTASEAGNWAAGAVIVKGTPHDDPPGANILEISLRDHLLNVTTITDIVDQRIYGVIKPQGYRALPELLFFRTSSIRQVKFCGTDKLVNAQVQIDCYGIDGITAFTLAAVVRLALSDFVGQMGSTWVEQVTLENEFPLTDPDPGTIRVCQLFNFWYSED